MKVLFVGDKPSKLNSNPEVAFIGTPSHKNLLKWVDEIGIIKHCAMINSEALDVPTIVKYHVARYEIVALGNKASEVLTRMGLDHFTLPHPSPKNRKLNNKEFIADELKKCYIWLKVRE